MGQTIAILGAGTPPPMTDVAAYFSKYKPYSVSRAAGTYTQDLVGGPDRTGDTARASSSRTRSTSRWSSRSRRTRQIVHVLTATNAAGLFADGITHIVNQPPGCARGQRQLRLVRARRRRGDAGAERAVHAGDGGGPAVVLRCRRHRHRRLPQRDGQHGRVRRLAGVEPLRRRRRRHADQHRRAPAGVPDSSSCGTRSPVAPADGGRQRIARQAGVPDGRQPRDDGARDEPDVSALAGPPYINIYEAALGPLRQRSRRWAAPAPPRRSGPEFGRSSSKARTIPTITNGLDRALHDRQNGCDRQGLQRRHHSEQRRSRRHQHGRLRCRRRLRPRHWLGHAERSAS